MIDRCDRCIEEGYREWRLTFGEYVDGLCLPEVFAEGVVLISHLDGGEKSVVFVKLKNNSSNL